MAKAVMADSISHLPEFNAWYNVIKETLGEIDLGELLVYIIDTVDASALPVLAEQFDVLGYKGFRLATTEADQREVLKRSIELHKYKGTEWAIKQALISIGFPDIELIKTGYDHWAKFGIRLTNTNLSISPSAFTDITRMVKEYKRAVCVLEEIRIDILVEDTLDMTDDIADAVPAINAEDNLQLSGTLKYDGEAEYDGTNDHSGDSDVVSITAI
jgi:P2-related tail formation protein